MIICIGTGLAGATFYPMGAGISEIITNEIDEIKNATAQVTAASYENVRLLQRGYIQFAITNAASVWDAHRGLKPIKEKLGKVRTICWAHASDLHLITLERSGIKTFADIKGKKFSIGSPGSGCQVMMERLIKALGYTYKDFKIQFLNYTTSANALKDRRLHVMTVSAGSPAAVVMDLASTRDIHMIALSEKEMNTFLQAYPIYSTYVIPAGTYKGMNEGLKVLCSPATFSCSVDLPEDIVYKVTKVVYNKIPWLAENIHQGFNRWSFEPDIKKLAPLHPGAVKFYKEIGKLQ
jgi:TRAP transporter TAXI family solute receptor